MEDQKYYELELKLKKVSKETIIDFYDEFKAKNNIESIKKQFRELKNWKENSIKTKAGVGKSIFKEFSEKDILECIISSNAKKAVIEKAILIYEDLFPNEVPKTIRFIRPEFEFEKKIVKRLFSRYKIESQYEVEFDNPKRKHKIDWWIPDLKLAIEYDERHHRRNKKEDQERELRIKEKLECNFIRFEE